MFKRRKIKSSKRNLRPFQRGYKGDIGPIFTLSTSIIVLFLVFILCFVIYNIIYAIRMV